MNVNSCTREHVEQLYVRFVAVYGHKFTSSLTTPQMVETWYCEAHELLAGVDVNLMMEAFNNFKRSSEWPPSTFQILKYCEQKTGLPSESEVLRLMIARDFTHEVVKTLFDKIGSFSFGQDKEETTRAKIKELYPDILAEFRSRQQQKALGQENHQPLNLLQAAR